MLGTSCSGKKTLNLKYHVFESVLTFYVSELGFRY